MAFIAGNPASLTIQVTVIGNRYKLKGRKQFTPFLSFFEFPKPKPSFPSHIDDEFTLAPPVCF
jgi:hypothetical protein